jgi:hypothetical protein
LLAVLTACRIVPDGDPKVMSEQTLTLAAAPEPLPDPDAAVVKVRYRFGDGWKILGLAVERAEQRSIAGRPRAFGLWVHGDGRKTGPRLRLIDARGQTRQPDGDVINWKGWRYLQFEWNPSTHHWGGPNNGVLHFLLAWDALFLLDNLSQKPNTGTIYLAAPVLIY